MQPSGKAVMSSLAKALNTTLGRWCIGLLLLIATVWALHHVGGHLLINFSV
jgi:preprotein translocase subunit SecF